MANTKTDNAAQTKVVVQEQTTKGTTTHRALAEKYRKSYPDCKTFYITSDEQVFLGESYNMALLHQNSLKVGELTTINF